MRHKSRNRHMPETLSDKTSQRARGKASFLSANANKIAVQEHLLLFQSSLIIWELAREIKYDDILEWWLRTLSSKKEYRIFCSTPMWTNPWGISFKLFFVGLPVRKTFQRGSSTRTNKRLRRRCSGSQGCLLRGIGRLSMSTTKLAMGMLPVFASFAPYTNVFFFLRTV